MSLDVTPLLGAHTGVAAFTTGAMTALAKVDGVALSAYAVTWRGRRSLGRVVPAGVRIVERPMPARGLRTLWQRVDGPVIEWWTGAIDVVHGTNFVAPPTRRAAAVATVHDLTPVRFPELSTPDTLQYPGLLRRALRRGAHVHTPSAFVAAEVVERLGAHPDRVHAVHHGVPPVEGGDPAVGRALAGTGDYVLALGTIEPRKDLPTLVAAFDQLAGSHPGLRLVVAGPDGWGVNAFDDAVRRMAHADRLVRLGWVGGAERAGLLAGARAFAYPSVYEGFGFPPLEAMAMGVPVVATSAGSLPEVLGDAAVLVPPGDVDALAAGLAAVVGDEDLRTSLATTGAARVASYRWDRCAEGLVDVYRQAMA